MAAAGVARRARCIASRCMKPLAVRHEQRRMETWPKEYSRKNWHLGPPKLPKEIEEWMRQVERDKLEKLEEEDESIVPPGPKIRGTSALAVTLPRLRNNNKRDEQHEEDEKSYEERMDKLLAYYKECAATGVVPEKVLGVKMQFKTYAYLLLQCGDERTLARGKWAHAHILSHGHAGNRFLSNCTMAMYSKCGSLKDVQLVFDDITWRNVFSWTILMRAYSDHGEYKQALRVFQMMNLEHEDLPNEITFSSVISTCAALGWLEEGKKIHQQVLESEVGSCIPVGNALVSMYGRCGAVKEAKRVFDSMEFKDVVSWNALITAYAQNGHSTEALLCLPKMEVEGMSPDMVTFLCILDAFSSPAALAQGREIHRRVIGLGPNVASSTALVHMYGKCGSLEDAKRVFDEMPEKDVIAWSSMIAAYAQSGHGNEALGFYRQMELEGMKPNRITFISLLDACNTLGALSEGREMQARLVEAGLDADTVAQNALVNLFGKCGNLEEAKSVFDSMPERDVVSWNAMIALSIQQGLCVEALELLKQMHLEGVKPDRITFISVLDGFSALEDLSQGKNVHVHVIESGFGADVVVQNALVNMYGKCGSLEDARNVFDGIPEKDVISWNAMISASARHQHGNEAFELLKRMDVEGVKPDRITFIGLLEACRSLAALSEGKEIHARIADGVYDSEMLETALVDMYGKCGSFEDAMNVFEKMPEKDTVSWTAMIGASVENGEGRKALKLLQEMDLQGMKPNKVTFVRLLDACGNLAALLHGKMIHARIGSSGLEPDVIVDTSLFTMYAKCGCLAEARSVFEQMHWKSIVSWNGMVAAYAHHGYGKEALELLQDMDLEGIKPDEVTFISLLDACGTLADRKLGDAIYTRLVQSGFQLDVVVGTALFNMYAKCGNLEDARSVFDRMDARSEVSWNAMVAAYAQVGHAKEAIELFTDMELHGVRPDKVTFVGLLFACSHAGLLEQGCLCCYSMVHDHRITPQLEHYSIMVDILGRAGWLNEAEKMINRMPEGQADAVPWTSLLSACGIHGDVERGARAAERASHLQPEKSAPYVMLSNIYAAAGGAQNQEEMLSLA